MRTDQSFVADLAIAPVVAEEEGHRTGRSFVAAVAELQTLAAARTQGIVE